MRLTVIERIRAEDSVFSPRAVSVRTPACAFCPRAAHIMNVITNPYTGDAVESVPFLTQDEAVGALGTLCLPFHSQVHRQWS